MNKTSTSVPTNLSGNQTAADTEITRFSIPVHKPLPSDAIPAHIAPIAFRHINFHGVYRFPLERYLDRLLPSALTHPNAVGAK
jgi:hypothetical protein